MDPNNWSQSTCAAIGYIALAVLFFHNLPTILVALAICFALALLEELLK